MILQWLNASEATEVGASLADQYSARQRVHPNARPEGSERADLEEHIVGILRQSHREVHALRLNFYKRAKLANSFKWRLLENGVEQSVAHAATERLILHLSVDRSSAVSVPMPPKPDRLPSSSVKELLARANQFMLRHAYEEAVESYEQLVAIAPRHAIALNGLGAALSNLGRRQEGEACFHQAIKVEPDFAEAHSNIGNVLFLKGQHAAAEAHLRRAVKLNPRLVQARFNLGMTLAASSRLHEAKLQFEKALKFEPRAAEALTGLAYVAMTEGLFEEASGYLERALRESPGMPKALAMQANLRKMTRSDSEWLQRAEEVADSAIPRLDESELRFSIAKFHDDVGDFEQAFRHYERANKLLKSVAEPFKADTYKNFVDLMIRTFTPAVVDTANGRGSESTKPVLVVGMPRSGTSLAEQIIASHPSAKGAGELAFWEHAAQDHEARTKPWLPDDSDRLKIAEGYLTALQSRCGDASRIVDKAPVNSDFLGIFHSVFPKARIIHMQRDPIDTCLSCYFQMLILSLNFTMDLSDLAAYYREHHRLMAHWRSVLPRGTMLDVPYEELVSDQEGWSRKILEFLDLDWDTRVLSFHETQRPVATASFWQVRQKVYNNSVHRWRHYEKFIGPLKSLKKLPR